MTRARIFAAALALAAATLAAAAGAEPAPPRLAAPEPALPYPAEGDGRAVSVLLELVVGKDGAVEEVRVRAIAPADAAPVFAAAASEAAKKLRFEPATQGDAAIRARVSHLVMFQPPPRSTDALPRLDEAKRPSPPPLTTNERDEDHALTAIIPGEKLNAPRGVGDFRIQRELIDAAPHFHASEILSAAPGFFVDHEDGEGLGNDVYLRGFDLEHGSGIEFHVGNFPINIPLHILGQGYADLNFVIPEVVESVHVVEGVFDPHQGDAAIVGSVDVDLGVAERGEQVRLSYGSFNQARLVGIFAPVGEDHETFAAIALRRTDGFGPDNRGSQSASANAQYAFEIEKGYRVRLLTTAYAASAKLPGVVRQDDVDAKRIDYYDSYASPYARHQSTDSSRFLIGADLDHLTAAGHFEVTTWTMLTSLRLRENFTGNLDSSLVDPAFYGRGDLLQSKNDETAVGGGARFEGRTLEPWSFLRLRAEPGVSIRYGASSQSQRLLSPLDLKAWDDRVDDDIHSLDIGAYLDVEAKLWRRLHLTGGVRVDALHVATDDHLANLTPIGATPTSLPGAAPEAFGVVVSPKASLGYDVADWLTPIVSYGEGFRSLDVGHLSDGDNHPYSKVRSAEAGLRAHLLDDRYSASVAFYETWVGNELVFNAVAGGLETEGASIRRGLVASILGKPLPWLLGSFAISMNRSTYEALSADGNHFVPGIPAMLFRADVAAEGRVFKIAAHDVKGRVGVGFTLIGQRYLTDLVRDEATPILNAKAALRYRSVEVGVDGYNLLGLKYADDAEYYISNWSTRAPTPGGPVQPPASFATHIVAAPPLTVLATVGVHL